MGNNTSIKFTNLNGTNSTEPLSFISNEYSWIYIDENSRFINNRDVQFDQELLMVVINIDNSQFNNTRCNAGSANNYLEQIMQHQSVITQYSYVKLIISHNALNKKNKTNVCIY